MGQSLWLAGRATGLVSVPLLTLSVVLGLAGAARFTTAHWPRFTLAALHRNLSMLTVLFVGIHVSAALLRPGSQLRWLDAVLPFGSAYEHPVRLGLGTVALDLMLAAAITSVLRTRISPRAWSAVHSGAYAAWPVGVAHGFVAEGPDALRTWVIVLNALCVAVLAGAVVWRLMSDTHPDERARRVALSGRR